MIDLYLGDCTQCRMDGSRATILKRGTNVSNATDDRIGDVYLTGSSEYIAATCFVFLRCSVIGLAVTRMVHEDAAKASLLFCLGWGLSGSFRVDSSWVDVLHRVIKRAIAYEDMAYIPPSKQHSSALLLQSRFQWFGSDLAGFPTLYVERGEHGTAGWVPKAHAGIKKKQVTRVGFEPTPSYEDEKTRKAGKLSKLESHAIDRSAILPLQHHRDSAPTRC